MLATIRAAPETTSRATPHSRGSARCDAPAPAPAVTAAAKLTVHVLGRVKIPGTLRLDAGAQLSDARTAAGADVEKLVARVGGAPVPDTDCALGGSGSRNVYLMRTTESSKATAYVIDVSLARQQHDLRYDPLLQDNDRIYVPECRPKVKVISTPPTFPAHPAREPAEVERPGGARTPPPASGMHVGRPGGLAQLVEHLHGMQGVRSSSLLSSTSPLG